MSLKRKDSCTFKREKPLQKQERIYRLTSIGPWRLIGNKLTDGACVDLNFVYQMPDGEIQKP